MREGTHVPAAPLRRRRGPAADPLGERGRAGRRARDRPAAARDPRRARAGPPAARPSPAADAGRAGCRAADWRRDLRDRPARARRRPGRRRPRDRRHGAQHRPAAPGDARRAAAARGARRRADRQRRAGHRLHAPRRREAVRGARLPPDHRAGQPARLALGVQQRARGGARRRGDARHGGARAGGVAAHPARRAEPGPLAPDVPRLLPARARRHHAGLLRVPRARGAAGGHGGGLRRADALHVQPGRRPQGGRPRRLARAGSSGRQRRSGAGCPSSSRSSSATRSSRPAPAGWACSTPRPARPTASRGRSRAPAGSTSTCAATTPTSRTPRCSPPAAPAGSSPAPPATAWPGSRCCSSRCTSASTSREACLDTLGTLPAGPVNQRLPKVLKVPEGERYTATENPLGFNGYYLVSRGEKTPWRLEAALGVVQQRAGALAGAARLPRRRHGRGARLDVLRRRRRRQVSRGCSPGRTRRLRAEDSALSHAVTSRRDPSAALERPADLKDRRRGLSPHARRDGSSAAHTAPRPPSALSPPRRRPPRGRAMLDGRRRSRPPVIGRAPSVDRHRRRVAVRREIARAVHAARPLVSRRPACRDAGVTTIQGVDETSRHEPSDERRRVPSSPRRSPTRWARHPRGDLGDDVDARGAGPARRRARRRSLVVDVGEGRHRRARRTPRLFDAVEAAVDASGDVHGGSATP